MIDISLTRSHRLFMLDLLDSELLMVTQPEQAE